MHSALLLALIPNPAANSVSVDPEPRIPNLRNQILFPTPQVGLDGPREAPETLEAIDELAAIAAEHHQREFSGPLTQTMTDTEFEAMVAGGHGLAILPRFTTRDHGNGLVTRPLIGVRARREISAVLRPDRFQRPSVRLVVQTLREEARAVADAHGAA